MPDKYGKLEFTNITANQANAAGNFVEGLNIPGIKSVGIEWSPTNVDGLAANTIRFNVAADTVANLVQWRDAVKAQAFAALGITPSVETLVESTNDGLRACFQTHGVSLANRPALKACVIDVWNNQARLETADDVQARKQWLISRGINSRAELIAFLNET